MRTPGFLGAKHRKLSLPVAEDMGFDPHEVCNLADPAICKALTSRAYRLVGFENVLACRPTAAEVAADISVAPLADTEIDSEEDVEDEDE